MCIDIVEIWFGITDKLISSMIIFHFRTITLVNINGFSTNLICTLILWRCNLGILLGKFHQFLTELSACDVIMVGYYRFTFLIFDSC